MSHRGPRRAATPSTQNDSFPTPSTRAPSPPGPLRAPARNRRPPPPGPSDLDSCASRALPRPLNSSAAARRTAAASQLPDSGQRASRLPPPSPPPPAPARPATAPTSLHRVKPHQQPSPPSEPPATLPASQYTAPRDAPQDRTPRPLPPPSNPHTAAARRSGGAWQRRLCKVCVALARRAQRREGPGLPPASQPLSCTGACTGAGAPHRRTLHCGGCSQPASQPAAAAPLAPPALPPCPHTLLWTCARRAAASASPRLHQQVPWRWRAASPPLALERPHPLPRHPRPDNQGWCAGTRGPPPHTPIPANRRLPAGRAWAREHEKATPHRSCTGPPRRLPAAASRARRAAPGGPPPRGPRGHCGPGACQPVQQQQRQLQRQQQQQQRPGCRSPAGARLRMRARPAAAGAAPLPLPPPTL
jgi:hypothetical protein